MLILTAEDLNRVLDIPSCVQAMRQAFLDVRQGAYVMPLRQRVRPEGAGNWMTLMPALRRRPPERWVLKQMVVTPGNSRVGRDPLQGSVLLHDGADGTLLAMADVPALTSLRTAATTVLATQALAAPAPAVIAIVGTGIQGRTHARAMRAVFPHAQLRIWGRTGAHARELARELGGVAATTIQEAVEAADVVCTTTASHEPILRREWLKPGCHVNAVGSSTPDAREIDGATMAAATLFVDQRHAALNESGDVMGAIRDGAITASHIAAELGEVLAGAHPGRHAVSGFSLFKSLGFGAQDLAALELALDNALRMGVGKQIDW